MMKASPVAGTPFCLITPDGPRLMLIVHIQLPLDPAGTQRVVPTLMLELHWALSVGVRLKLKFARKPPSRTYPGRSTPSQAQTSATFEASNGAPSSRTLPLKA